MTRGPITCAAPCCRVQIERGKWFCPAHWFTLSDRLRKALGATWRARHIAAFQELWTEALAALDPTPRLFEVAPSARTTPPTIAYEGEQPVVYATGEAAVSWLPRIYVTTTTICEDEGEFEGPILIIETRRWRIQFSVARLIREVKP